MILGVDVSEWQGRPDWRLVHDRGGVAFAFARATYGSQHPDATYGYNRAAIPAAGIIPGAYHFLTAGDPVAAQADAFCARADPAARHALDVEQAGSRPVDVAGWVARYRTHFPDHALGIYTGRDLWAATAGGIHGATFGPLWAAGYLPNLYVPAGTDRSLAALAALVGTHQSGLPWAGWGAAEFLQFTDQARVPGISGPVDGDIYLGTLDQLQATTGVALMLSDPDKAWLKTEVEAAAAAAITAALPAIADTVVHRYQVHVPGSTALEATTDALSQILAAVQGLTPQAVAAAAAQGQGAATSTPTAAGPVDVHALAAAITATLNVRAEVAAVLLEGATAAAGA